MAHSSTTTARMRPRPCPPRGTSTPARLALPARRRGCQPDGQPRAAGSVPTAAVRPHGNPILSVAQRPAECRFLQLRRSTMPLARWGPAQAPHAITPRDAICQRGDDKHQILAFISGKRRDSAQSSKPDVRSRVCQQKASTIRVRVRPAIRLQAAQPVEVGVPAPVRLYAVATASASGPPAHERIRAAPAAPVPAKVRLWDQPAGRAERVAAGSAPRARTGSIRPRQTRGTLGTVPEGDEDLRVHG